MGSLETKEVVPEKVRFGPKSVFLMIFRVIDNLY